MAAPAVEGGFHRVAVTFAVKLEANVVALGLRLETSYTLGCNDGVCRQIEAQYICSC